MLAGPSAAPPSAARPAVSLPDESSQPGVRAPKTGPEIRPRLLGEWLRPAGRPPTPMARIAGPDGRRRPHRSRARSEPVTPRRYRHRVAAPVDQEPVGSI